MLSPLGVAPSPDSQKLGYWGVSVGTMSVDVLPSTLLAGSSPRAAGRPPPAGTGGHGTGRHRLAKQQGHTAARQAGLI